MFYFYILTLTKPPVHVSLICYSNDRGRGFLPAKTFILKSKEWEAPMCHGEQHKAPRDADAPRETKQCTDNYFERQVGIWRDRAKIIFAGLNHDDANSMAPKQRFGQIIGASMGKNDRVFADSVHAIFSRQLAEYRSNLHERLRRYMSPRLAAAMVHGEDDLISDPLFILMTIGTDDIWSKLNEREKFVYIRDLQWAFEFFFIATHVNGWHSDMEMDEPRRMNEFLQWLLTKGAQPQLTTAYIDPKNYWRFAGASKPKTKRVRHRLRRVTLQMTPVILNENSGSNGGVRALVAVRQKQKFEIIAKRILTAQSAIVPTRVSDLFGVRLVYSRRRDVDEGVRALRIFQLNEENALRVVERANPFASGNLHIVSQQIPLNGQIREVQHMSLSDLVNITYSTGEENHELYHLRGALAVLFREMFPEKYFGIDWTAEDVQQECIKHIISQQVEANLRLPPFES